MSEIQNNRGSISGSIAVKGTVSGGTLTPKGSVKGGAISRNQGGTKDYERLNNLPYLNEEELIGHKTSEDYHIASSKTTAEWDEETELVSILNEVYIYSDASEDENGDPVPMIKVGDGETLLSDLPFVAAVDYSIYEWARAETKPEYTYDEVGAVGAENELHITEIDRMFQTVFGE